MLLVVPPLVLPPLVLPLVLPLVVPVRAAAARCAARAAAARAAALVAAAFSCFSWRTPPCLPPAAFSCSLLANENARKPSSQLLENLLKATFRMSNIQLSEF